MNQTCKYCGHHAYHNRDICPTCAEKIVLVRRLLKIGQSIKNSAKGSGDTNE